MANYLNPCWISVILLLFIVGCWVWYIVARKGKLEKYGKARRHQYSPSIPLSYLNRVNLTDDQKYMLQQNCTKNAPFNSRYGNVCCSKQFLNIAGGIDDGGYCDCTDGGRHEAEDDCGG